jgi:hypothetical protein
LWILIACYVAFSFFADPHGLFFGVCFVGLIYCVRAIWRS